MEQRGKINLDGSNIDLIAQMSEGNPGAMTVLVGLMKVPNLKPPGPLFLLHLDDMNIRGSQIWVGYKDYCKEDMPAFAKAVQDRDPNMVAMINEFCGHEHLAAVGQAAPGYAIR